MSTYTCLRCQRPTNRDTHPSPLEDEGVCADDITWDEAQQLADDAADARVDRERREAIYERRAS